MMIKTKTGETVMENTSQRFGKTTNGMVRALAFAASAVCAFAASAGDLGGEITSGKVWTYNAQAFAAAHRNEGYRFLTAARDSASCQRLGSVTLAGHQVYDTRIWFDQGDAANGRVRRIELSLFNRGDTTGTLTGQKLEKMLSDVRGAFEESEKWSKPEKSEKLDSLFFVQRLASRQCHAELAWGTAKKKQDGAPVVNFVRLALTRADATTAHGRPASSGGRQKTRSASEIARNVERRDNGDVVIKNVPMVDQGPKGYCAVATAERVLRYFGIDVDEHELAQMAGTTASSGTSSDATVKTIDKIGSAWQLGRNYIYLGTANRRAIEKTFAEYDKMAKKEGKPLVSNKIGHVLNYGELIYSVDPETYKKSRVKQHGDFTKFRTGIKQQTEKGIPLIWGVMLGLFPENDIPQAQGGHIRLIIGYNEKTKEILYSDSWGARHEEKRMDVENAWAITHSLFYLRPLR